MKFDLAMTDDLLESKRSVLGRVFDIRAWPGRSGRLPLSGLLQIPIPGRYGG